MKKLEMMTVLVSIEALLETNNEKKALELVKKVISQTEGHYRRERKEKWRHKHEDRKEKWRERHMHKHEGRWEEKARRWEGRVHKHEGRWEEKARRGEKHMHKGEDNLEEIAGANPSAPVPLQNPMPLQGLTEN